MVNAWKMMGLMYRRHAGCFALSSLACSSSSSTCVRVVRVASNALRFRYTLSIKARPPSVI
jgi:hypothetical protein